MAAWGDVKDKELDPRKVIQARKGEIEYIHRMGLYTKVPQGPVQEGDGESAHPDALDRYQHAG